MVLDDSECMRGPAWSVTLLGVDVGFACKHVDDPLDLSMTIYRCCYHLSRNQYDVIINLCMGDILCRRKSIYMAESLEEECAPPRR